MRAVTLGDQQVELVDFHADEASTQQEGDAQPGQNTALVAMPKPKTNLGRFVASPEKKLAEIPCA